MKAGWLQIPLSSVAQVGAGNAAPQDDAYFVEGTHPFFRTSDAGRVRFGDIAGAADYLNEKGAKNLRHFPAGTILFPKSGASTFLNHRVMMGVDGYVSSHLATIIGDESKVNRRFLLYFLSTVSAQDLVQDHAYPSLNLPLIESIQISLPPRPEQQRIVGILDEAFEGIATAKAHAEKNLQNARAMFESHLESTFQQRGNGWTETILEELLAEQPRNGWSPPARNHSIAGVPVLTLSSVTGFQFLGSKKKFTSAQTDPGRHYWVKNGDFLITRSNTPELVGHVAIAEGLDEPTIYPDLIMKMNPAPDRMFARFLYYQMRTRSLRTEITGRAQGANPTMKKIGKRDVQTLPIVAPSIQVQKAIVGQLDSLAAESQRLESIYQRKLAALDALKKSLLHQAFSGQL